MIFLLFQTLYVLVAVLAVASCLPDKENRRRPGLRGKARAGARKVARHEDKVTSVIIIIFITIMMVWCRESGCGTWLSPRRSAAPSPTGTCISGTAGRTSCAPR